MLLELHIQNFALIDSLAMEFHPALNVLTGETGAGKSILIEALRLALGERMDALQARDPQKSCTIQAVFTLEPEIRAKDPRFQDFAPAKEDYLVFKRELTSEGRSKSYLNGQFVNQSTVRELGNYLINIHSQHDHQEILQTASHRPMLDRFAQSGGKGQKFSAAAEHYQGLYRRYRELVESKEKLAQDCAQKEREMDLLRFQTDEIRKVGPEAGEWERLKEDHIRLAHAEKLFQCTETILQTLDESEQSVSARLAEIFRPASEWERIDPSASEATAKMNLLQEQITDLVRTVQNYREKLTFDPERLRETEERLDQLERLVKKYGAAVRSDRTDSSGLESVLRFYETAAARLATLENSETLEADLKKEIAQLLPGLEKAADALSSLRRAAAEDLSKALMKELAELGIKHGQFVCRIGKADLAGHGRDQVEFLLSANAGAPLKPLSEVASGGEAARIMLALKKTLAQADDIPALIFDEIDANIGGRLGKTVGEKIAAISRHRQVLLITHLPQIASFADRHMKVTKRSGRKETTVEYLVLEGEDKVRELAQMMSGEQETNISKTHAAEMLRSAGMTRRQ